MRVLVACEFSGIVRDAFIAQGHEAMSCDLLPTEREGPHYQGDVLDILDLDWDLMVAHPPCTYLSTVRNRWIKHDPEHTNKMMKGLAFFLELYNAPIPKVAVENPQGRISSLFRPPDQTVHPYYFGNSEMKRTCFWLRGLPPLLWEKGKYPKPEPVYYCKGERCKGKAIYRTESYRGVCSDRRSLERAKTYQGIADAMASQWGSL